MEDRFEAAQRRERMTNGIIADGVGIELELELELATLMQSPHYTDGTAKGAGAAGPLTPKRQGRPLR